MMFSRRDLFAAVLGGVTTAGALLLLWSLGQDPGETPAAARTQAPELSSCPPCGQGPLEPQGRFSPSPPRQEGSPDLPHPISFPKVFAGFHYFEKHRPELVLTAAQCRRLIPVLDNMGRIWRKNLEVATPLQKLLTPAQEAFISKNKDRLGKSSTKRVLNQKLRQQTGISGRFHELTMVALFCRQRALEPSSETTWIHAEGKLPISNFDVSSGIVLMEDHPELRLKPAQGRAMAPIFDLINSSQQMTQQYFQMILKIITTDQLKAVFDDYDRVKKFKMIAFKKYYRNKTERDAVFDGAIDLCQKKLAQGR